MAFCFIIFGAFLRIFKIFKKIYVKNIDAINDRTSMIKATEQHKQKREWTKWSCYYIWQSSLSKEWALLYQQKVTYQEVFLPTNPKYKKTKGWLFICNPCFFYFFSSNCHVTSQANWDNLFFQSFQRNGHQEQRRGEIFVQCVQDIVISISIK